MTKDIYDAMDGFGPAQQAEIMSLIEDLELGFIDISSFEFSS